MKQHLGWEASAQAWIDSNGEQGDKSRKFILDPALTKRLEAGRFRRALDVGCGEGRFCRVLQARGIKTVGIDPTPALISHAHDRDPDGDYRMDRAEQMSFEDASFDLVISYLSMIDIPDFRAAISEIARVLEPGGTLLVVSLTDFNSAGMKNGWRKTPTGEIKEFALDNYSSEWSAIVEWAGVRVENWHRPLDAYMQAYLKAGLTLTHYEHPMPVEEGQDLFEKYPRAPWFNLMEWRKPSMKGEAV